MLKNKFNLLVIINTIGLLVIFSFLLFKFFATKEIVYVDNIKLFDGFNMTKEMKRLGEKEFNARKRVVDSLYAITQSQELPQDNRNSIVQEFVQKRDELEQFGQVFASSEANKIWARLQSYTQEYGKEKGYTIIVGSENKRNVLFADESVDVTSDLINYINKKYEGLK